MTFVVNWKTKHAMIRINFGKSLMVNPISFCSPTRGVALVQSCRVDVLCIPLTFLEMHIWMNETNSYPLVNQVSAPEKRALDDFLKSTGRVGTQIVGRYFSVRKLIFFLLEKRQFTGFSDAAHQNHICQTFCIDDPEYELSESISTLHNLNPCL